MDTKNIVEDAESRAEIAEALGALDADPNHVLPDSVVASLDGVTEADARKALKMVLGVCILLDGPSIPYGVICSAVGQPSAGDTLALQKAIADRCVEVDDLVEQGLDVGEGGLAN